MSLNIIDGSLRTPLDFGWTQSLIGALVPYYGLKGAARITSVILPGVLKDFRKCLKQAPSGKVIKETYAIDDGKAEICLSGSRGFRKGRTADLLHEITVNGEAVVIDGQIWIQDGLEI